MTDEQKLLNLINEVYWDLKYANNPLAGTTI